MNYAENVCMPVTVGIQNLLARQMFIFARSKFLHFHGETHARLERNVSVYGDNDHQRTWLVSSLSPILFFAPDFHLRNLQDMWVDRIMHKSVFRESMKKMNDEWDHFVLFATVMLNANVAFLAIQSVDNNESPQRSAAQICSYVSMFASIGSIVLGLHLSRQNTIKGQDNNAVKLYIKSRSDSRFGGLETLAILTIVGFCVASSIILISWCIQTSWDKEEVDTVIQGNNYKINRSLWFTLSREVHHA
ncbi:hypothetical protein CVT25_009838 [Psilocybe cyanescens]|uniref:Uncharacterized protein n=1 Tax=Psilocybe cyanescens TaxID=93625 RepID=A0A409XQA8_PSICY|nr:hypothetical protein CVT25_009838 [Psilocybe cyanescens]